MNTTPTTTADHAAVVRQALKTRFGWTSRDVSVRADNFSMGSALRLRIKSTRVSAAAVREVASASERIDRDERTGDILSGGNRYVSVSWDEDVLAAVGAPYVARVEAAVAAREDAGDSSLIPVEGTPYMVGRGRCGNEYSVWEREAGHRQECYGVAGVAQWVGAAMLDAEYAGK